MEIAIVLAVLAAVFIIRSSSLPREANTRLTGKPLFSRT